MVRKIYSMNLDQDKIMRLDQMIISPCSRSDIVDDIIGFVLQSPYVIDAFIKSKLIEFESKVNNT